MNLPQNLGIQGDGRLCIYGTLPAAAAAFCSSFQKGMTTLLLALFSSSLSSRLNVVSLLMAAAAAPLSADSAPEVDAASFSLTLAATILTAPSLVISKVSDLTEGFPVVQLSC